MKCGREGGGAHVVTAVVEMLDATTFKLLNNMGVCGGGRRKRCDVVLDRGVSGSCCWWRAEEEGDVRRRFERASETNKISSSSSPASSSFSSANVGSCSIVCTTSNTVPFVC